MPKVQNFVVFLSSIFCALFIHCSLALASDDEPKNKYFRISVMGVDAVETPLKAKTEDDLGYGISLALGMKNYADGMEFFDNFRVEGEFAYRTYQYKRFQNGVRLSESSVDTFSMFLNLYFDKSLTKKLSPYIGLGIGMAGVFSNIESGSGTDRRGAGAGVNVMTGANYAVTEKIDVSFGYRFLYAYDPTRRELGNLENDNSASHNFELGFLFWTK